MNNTSVVKKITVVGDKIKDIHLIEPPGTPTFHHEALPTVSMEESGGGVDFLSNIMKKLFPETTVECPDSEMETVNVYQLWKAYPKNIGEKKEKVFRVDRLIGRRVGESDTHPSFEEINTSGSDLLVIDSLGLGWLKRTTQTDAGEKSPFSALVEAFKGDDIILKLSSLANGLPCIDERISRCFYDKLTVVVSAASLRERGASISRGLSWDQTIEDMVQEFSEGISSRDLSLCRRVVVLFSSEAVAIFGRNGSHGKAFLQKFIYHPGENEGSYNSRYEGKMFGNLSTLTAAIVRHIADPSGYPLFAAVCLALQAIRVQLADGISLGGNAKDFLKKPPEKIIEILNAPYHYRKMPEKEKGEQKAKKEFAKQYFSCLDAFTTSFNDDLMSNKRPEAGRHKSNLLADATGYGYEYMAAKAFDIVIKGPDDSLSSMPKVKYGKYLTADREEIERINAMRNLIVRYGKDLDDKKPLSVAVFGPPGSGKSFAIKQLAGELGYAQSDMIEFNLSQFAEDDREQIHIAFHKVRDASIRGKTPLVFWDEFDANGYCWLKDFLAPMQDAVFTAGSVTHPLGKAIFIFAGGVHHSFDDFKTNGGKKKDHKGETREDRSSLLKIPDFISRLRGYVNIKGPNPASDIENSDQEYLIRRAILLRTFLETSCSRIKNDKGLLAVSAPLVQAFLRVKSYLHGARSMEALVRMSETIDCTFLGESALPPKEQMSLHVNVEDFQRILREDALDTTMIELIAGACHNGWMEQKKNDGYKLGDERCDYGENKTHPLLRAYHELSEQDKEGNRITARLTLAKFAEVNIGIRRSSEETGGIDISGMKEKLYRIEHDVWLRDHLLRGYDYAEETNDTLRLHKCMKRFDNLSKEEQRLDIGIIDSIVKSLQDKGYVFTSLRETRAVKPNMKTDGRGAGLSSRFMKSRR